MHHSIKTKYIFQTLICVLSILSLRGYLSLSWNGNIKTNPSHRDYMLVFRLICFEIKLSIGCQPICMLRPSAIVCVYMSVSLESYQEMKTTNDNKKYICSQIANIYDWMNCQSSELNTTNGPFKCHQSMRAKLRVRHKIYGRIRPNIHTRNTVTGVPYAVSHFSDDTRHKINWISVQSPR